MPEELYSGEITEDQLLFREILSLTSLGKLCHSDFSEGAGAWSSNTLNYFHAVNQLLVLTIRHLDSEFFMNMERINKSFTDKWFAYKKQEPDADLRREMSMRMTLQYSDLKFAALLIKMDEAGIYNEKSVHSLPPEVDEKDIGNVLD